MAVLVLIPIAPIGTLKNLTIDLQLHDTYIVIDYFTFITPNLIYFGLIGVVYYINFKKKRKLRVWTIRFHFFLTLLTTMAYVLLSWNYAVEQSGLSQNPISFPETIYQPKIFYINLLLFLIAQAVFFFEYFNAIRKARDNKHYHP